VLSYRILFILKMGKWKGEWGFAIYISNQPHLILKTKKDANWYAKHIFHIQIRLSDERKECHKSQTQKLGLDFSLGAILIIN
jgi:hypothetical protein